MDGEWQNWFGAAEKGSSLSLAPIFQAEVCLRDGCWWATLNGENCGGYSTRERAMARCDWEVWNRVRRFREAYMRVLARRASWENGGS